MSEMDYWEIREQAFEDPDPLTDVEKLAVAQAFYNAVGELVNTKNGPLRMAVNDFFGLAYDTTGAKSFDVKLMGQKVGTYSITVSKPKPSESRVTLDVVDEDELFNWADENGFVSWTIDREAVEEYFQESGEVPPGCKATEVVTPAEEGGRITRTTFKVDSGAVVEALGPRLSTVATKLLEGE